MPVISPGLVKSWMPLLTVTVNRVSLKHDGTAYTDGTAIQLLVGQMAQQVLGQSGQPIKTGQQYSYWWNRQTAYTDGTAYRFL